MRLSPSETGPSDILERYRLMISRPGPHRALTLDLAITTPVWACDSRGQKGTRPDIMHGTLFYICVGGGWAVVYVWINCCCKIPRLFFFPSSVSNKVYPEGMQFYPDWISMPYNSSTIFFIVIKNLQYNDLSSVPVCSGTSLIFCVQIRSTLSKEPFMHDSHFWVFRVVASWSAIQHWQHPYI